MSKRKTGTSKQQIASFRRRLLAWYAARKRDLPWRRTSDPYRIWISEIMLQQTRVAAVIPYYDNFVARFPTVETLANARPESVLSHWAGLGYYSRARNLHRAAKETVSRHGGQFPSDLDTALELPGIGRYTAAAVLSIAHGRPLAVLDGNVARVLARLGAVRGELRSPANWRKFEAKAEELLARHAPGDWNQAMMELGATICTPKSPNCRECPVASDCRARKLGIAEQIPAARSKRPTVQVTLAAAVFVDREGRTLLVREPNSGGAFFSRMWQFPALEISKNSAGELRKYLRKKTGAPVNGHLTALEALRHTVTFREIRLKPFLIAVAQLPRVDGMRAAALDDFRKLPISNATRKIADAARSHLRGKSTG
jgi:A/G-specific adenine glycosylase